MRHAVVSGTSSGIGRALAERLLRGGWRVSGLDRAAATLVHPDFRALTVDLADSAARADAIEGLEAADALVHCAGVMRGARLGELDFDAGAFLWRLHVEAAAALANHLAPGMREGGRIVLIGSRASLGAAQKSQYAAAKSALTGMARSWAKELAPRGITVNVVAPGSTDTAMLQDPARASTPPAPLPPIGRRIQADEVAALAEFLLSADAAAITGQEIHICGGSSL
ncbi:MAG: SDR family oxidoreductase [Burkholderiales bacterium]|nr:SDR family oxidoreductase [Burkholderiales bacterium]